MVVIVTDSQYRMTLPIVRDLHKAGYVVATVCQKGEPDVAGFSKATSYRHVIDITKENLLEICKVYQKPVLLCVGRNTIEIVSSNKEEFKEVSHLLISDKECIDRANDKNTVLSIAKELGIPIPRQYTIEQKDEISYPCIAKFPFGEKLGLAAKDRYFVVKSPEQLQKLVDKYPDLIIQEKIEGPGFGVSMLTYPGGKACDYICHKRIREYPVTGGPSSCCKTIDSPLLVDYSIKLLSALGFEGLAMVEWKGKSPETAVLMEVNPRVWGSFALTRASKSGLAEHWAKLSHTEFVLPIAPRFKRGKKMSFFTSELKLLAYNLKHFKLLAALSILIDMLNPFVKDGVFEWGDLSGSLAYIKSLKKRS